MLNLVEEDLEVIKNSLHYIEEIVRYSGDWVPTLLLVNGNEKIVLGYGESGDPCVLEAYDVNDKMKNLGLETLFGHRNVQDVH